MKRIAGSLLLVWTLSAGSSATAQIGSQTQAKASSLTAIIPATMNQLAQAENELRSARASLAQGEVRVQRGTLSRASLKPLQFKVQAGRERVRALLARRTELEAEQADLKRAMVDQRLRQLVAARYTQTEAENNVAEAVTREEAARAELQAATTSLDVAKQRFAAGVETQDSVTREEMQVRKARADVAVAQNEVQARANEQRRLSRLAVLQRPIDVELRDAPVRQAAQTISQACGLPIAVDPRVPAQTRLTVVARGVPLATVLDTIARQSGLLIAPTRTDNGIELKPMPTLEVNGQRTEILTPFAPWSSEWGMNPAASAGYSRYTHQGSRLAVDNLMLQRLDAAGVRAPTETAPGAAGVRPLTPGDAPAGEKPAAPGDTSLAPLGADALVPNSGKTPPRALYGGPPGATAPLLLQPRGFEAVPEANPFAEVPSAPFFSGPEGAPGYFRFGSAGGAPVVITALNDSTFVVAHPAAGPGGEPAVMLTVYRLQGSELRVVSTTLHRLDARQGSGGARAPVPGEVYGSGRRPSRRNAAPVAPYPTPLPDSRFAPSPSLPAPATSPPTPRSDAPATAPAP